MKTPFAAMDNKELHGSIWHMPERHSRTPHKASTGRRLLKFITSALIAAIPTTLAAADGENTIYRTDTGTFTPITLTGDSNPTTLTTRWEAELTNQDGNQNQMSMAKCGDHLFVCISHFDDIDGRKDRLFLRRYSTADGNADELSIALPDWFRTGVENHHTIASDSEGNLVAMLICEYANENNRNALRVTMCRIDVENRNLDTESRIDIDIPTNDDLYGSYNHDPWMERIDTFTGDFQSGCFRFGTTAGWRGPAAISNKFSYSHITIDYDAERVPQADIVTDQNFIIPNPENSDQNLLPDAAQLWQETFVVTRTPDNAGLCYPPTVFTRSEGETADNLSAAWASNSDMTNCRGFYPFTHNGHTLALFGKQHDTADNGKGAAFRIAALPLQNPLSGNTPLFDIPSVPFPSGGSSHPVYTRFYRQLAVTEPAPLSASHEENPSTHIYICSPGCGIGAYTLTTPSSNITTSLTNTYGILPDTTAPILRGRTLLLPHSDAESNAHIDLFTPTGIHMASFPAAAEIDLSPLPQGLYIVKTGCNTIKISLRQ